MNGNAAKPYNSKLSLVKALDLHGEMVWGYYLTYEKAHLVKVPNIPYKTIEINPYTVCRNSSITDKHDFYVFEYDLLKLTHGLKGTCYGYLVWDETCNAWKIRRRTDRTAYINIGDWTIEIIGNIVLNDADAEVIYKQEKAEDGEESFIDNSYCPSKFRR